MKEKKEGFSGVAREGQERKGRRDFDSDSSGKSCWNNGKSYIYVVLSPLSAYHLGKWNEKIGSL